MKIPILVATTVFLAGTAMVFAEGQSPLWLHFPPKEGTASGKKVVLISGDEEYRSEETCPMLGKILSQRHGFDCTVLFAIHPETGLVDPNFRKNIPGLEALAQADLMIIGTRFRELPEEQYRLIADFLNAGKPVIGFRTATHAFTGPGESGSLKWSEFGLKILGETWVNHHGKHRFEGTRGVVEPANAKHAVLRGVSDVFGPTDVYGIKNLDQSQATVLLRGAVTRTLEPESEILKEDPRNQPMMPLAWLREYTSPDGAKKGRAFCTTMGASVDFASEGLRRLVVNAALYLTGLEVPASADVAFVDPFDPTFYGFNKGQPNGPGYYDQRALKPAMWALGSSASTGLAPNTPRPPKLGEPAPGKPKS